MDPYQQNHNQPFMDDAMYQQFQQQQQPQYNEQNQFQQYQFIPQPEVPHVNQYEQQMGNTYVHQQPIYQQPAIMITQTMPVQTQAVIPSGAFISGMPTEPKGRNAEPFYCLLCRKNHVSNVKFDMGTGSWLWVSVFLFLFCPVSCCPCCVEDCQDAIHECPQCGREVGRNKFCN